MHTTQTHILQTTSVESNDSLGSSVSAESVPYPEDYEADEELASEDQETGNISSELVYESDRFSDDDFNLSQLFVTDSDRAEMDATDAMAGRSDTTEFAVVTNDISKRADEE